MYFLIIGMDNNFIVVHTMKRQGGYEMMNIVRLSIMAVLVALVASQMTTTYARGNQGGQGINHSKLVQIYAENQGTAAGLPKSGQPFPGFEPGDDGNLQKGVDLPNSRFTDNNNGTITDHLTNLIWDKEANRFGAVTWSEALSACNGLADGAVSPASRPSLDDDSSAGDWRLPNVRELHSLVHYGYTYPPISNAKGDQQWQEADPFHEIIWWTPYWTSTTYPDQLGLNDQALYVHFFAIGYEYNQGKGAFQQVWCVKGP
jgi:hypothetical protein